MVNQMYGYTFVYIFTRLDSSVEKKKQKMSHIPLKNYLKTITIRSKPGGSLRYKTSE